MNRTNLSGQYLLIDLSNSISRMYFLKVWNDRYYEVKKIIKQCDDAIKKAKK